MLALRAAATGPPPALASAATTNKSKQPFLISKFKPTSYTLLTLISTATNPNSATALTKEDLITSLTKVEHALEDAGEVGSSVLDFSKGTLRIVVDAMKPSLPVIQKAGNEAVKLVSPGILELSKQAQAALRSAGLDPEPVLTAAKTAAEVAGGAAQQTSRVIEEAKPIASATVETLSSSDPTVIVAAGGAFLLTYLLLPPIWSAISFSLRGYRGELTPAQTLDLVSKQNHLIIDVRPDKEKSKAGIPRLPSTAKSKLVAVPLEEIPSKIKGLVRNAKKVEAEIAALKISYLKRVNKGSKLVIMDSYTDMAKMVARTLTHLGFKNCWIMADGFSGRKGWLQSLLATDSYNVSIAEVVSPSRVIPAAVRRIGTISSRVRRTSQKLLPGSIDD